MGEPTQEVISRLSPKGHPGVGQGRGGAQKVDGPDLTENQHIPAMPTSAHLLFIYSFIQIDREVGGEAEREGDRGCKAGSVLTAESRIRGSNPEP